MLSFFVLIVQHLSRVSKTKIQGCLGTFNTRDNNDSQMLNQKNAQAMLYVDFISFREHIFSGVMIQTNFNNVHTTNNNNQLS